MVSKIARALDYAHKQGVLHRVLSFPIYFWLKMTNPLSVILELPVGSVMRVGARSTSTGIGIGTPEYMAPEQILGVEVDARTDIYSLRNHPF